ncbi:MAG: cytidine deaminase [Flavobacteriales bacterium]|nr:cytidine deaminase [Flavobacteriales bacterium]
MSQKQIISIELETVADISDLSSEEKNLVLAAKDVATRAYAPYSHFNVGAALLLSDGTIVTGSNQENAAYPSGLCAERVAMFSAGAAFPGKSFTKIAVYAHSAKLDLSTPVTPCGACRQVMAEYEDIHQNAIRVLMASDEKIMAVNGINALLPFRFKMPPKK